MPDPASLTPGAAKVREREVLEAIVNDDATTEDDLVRCEVPSFGKGWVTDPLDWVVITRIAGEFYPEAW